MGLKFCMVYIPFIKLSVNLQFGLKKRKQLVGMVSYLKVLATLFILPE